MRNPLLMKTFFRGERSIAENFAYFERLRDACRQFTEQMQTTAPDVEGYAAAVDDPKKAIYWQMTVDFGKMYIDMLQQWIDRCTQRLKEAADERSAD